MIGMAEALKMSLRGARGRQERIDKSREYIRRFEGNDVASQVADIYRGIIPSTKPKHTTTFDITMTPFHLAPITTDQK